MPFADAWGRAEPLLGPAVAHSGTHTLEAVREAVERREARLWLGRSSAMVTTIDEHPNFTALNIWLAGGDMDELVNEMRPAAERWAAAEHGATKATVVGRHGWARTLAPHDYTPVATVLMKDLRP